MSNFTTAEKAALRIVLEGLAALLALDEPTTAKAPKAKKAKAPKAPKGLSLDQVVVTIRSNGLLTAESGKAVREALVGTKAEGMNINGNTASHVATAVLTEVGVPFAVNEPEVTATEVMATVRAAKATAPKVEKAAKAAPAAPANKVTPEQRKAVNKAMGEHLRSMGVVPTGQAWEAAKKGERSAKKLLALNVADGLEPKAAAEKAPKAKAPKVAIVAELDPEKAAKLAKLVKAGFSEADALDIVGKLV